MAAQSFKRTSKFALGTIAAALLLAPGAAAETATPLPASNYSSVPVCRHAAPGRATCLARRLVARTIPAKRHRHPLAVSSAKVLSRPSASQGDFGLRPSDLHNAYALPAETGGHPLVAVVDSYNAPSIEADLSAYSREFGLPYCTTGDGCLRIVGERGASGELPFPHSTGELNSYLKGNAQQRSLAEAAESWGIEISLDVETVHAVCPACSIALVEATSESNESLFTAERTAEAMNPASITNSWGSIEEGSSDTQAPFNDPNTVITAAAGDEGYLSWYSSFEGCEARHEFGGPCKLEYANAPYFPASSPDVVSVGGTRLRVSPSGQREEETVWNGEGASGSGCSTVFNAPSWQKEAGTWASTGCGEHRAVADVAAVGDPYTGLAVYNSTSYCESNYPNESGRMETQHWCTIGGTSLASPLIAAAFALAGGNNGAEYPARYVYENARQHSGSLHDITHGSNGSCNLAMNAEEGLAACETGYEAQACEQRAICTAGAGYDGPTGVGTPNGLSALRPVGAPVVHGTILGHVVVHRISLAASTARSLRHGRPRVLTFSVDVTGTGVVHLRLYRAARRHHRTVWVAVGWRRKLDVHNGSNSSHLRTGRLRRGRYRLVASPLHGSTRSATFSAR